MNQTKHSAYVIQKTSVEHQWQFSGGKTTRHSIVNYDFPLCTDFTVIAVKKMAPAIKQT